MRFGEENGGFVEGAEVVDQLGFWDVLLCGGERGGLCCVFVEGGEIGETETFPLRLVFEAVFFLAAQTGFFGETVAFSVAGVGAMGFFFVELALLG